jgi:hypothetical protein
MTNYVIKSVLAFGLMLAFFTPIKAQAYEQHYTCRTVTVSIDGGATWGSTEVCEPTHITGRPMDHADKGTAVYHHAGQFFYISGIEVDIELAAEKCADTAQANFYQCNYQTATALGLGTAVCVKIGMLLSPASGTLCELGTIAGTVYLNNQCESQKYEANKKCPKP